MSSDSEVEEFFDAEEITPLKTASPVLAEAVHEHQKNFKSLDEQEKHLLQLKRESEQKLKEQDAKIQEELEEIKRKKQQEQDKLIADGKLLYHDAHRRKLEEMRKQMEDEDSQVAANIIESFDNPPDICSKDEVNSGTATAMSTVDKDSVITDLNSLADSISLGLDTDVKATSSADKEEQPILEEKRSIVEPDIVQSAKGSLERGKRLEAPPVAPPRRRKKQMAPGVPRLINVDDNTTTTSSLPDMSPQARVLDEVSGPIGLPAELLTPTTTAMILTQELEKALNNNGAICGEGVVQEDEGAKSNNVPDNVLSITKTSSLPRDSYQPKTGSLTKEGSNHDTKDDSLPFPKDGSLPHMQRPRSNSGRFLTDQEILESVMVVNLDTGEEVPLSQAEDRLPQCLNPLSLHIMRLTKEYSSGSNLHQVHGSDEEIASQAGDVKTRGKKRRQLKHKGIRLRKFIGKTVHKIKAAADEVLHEKESSSDSDDSPESRRMIKVKASSSHKGPYDFDLLVPVQDLTGIHSGAVWTMKFSHCGKLLATGGQDNLLKVWVLKDAFVYFDDMRQKYAEARSSPTPSQESLGSLTEPEESGDVNDDENDIFAPFRKKPFCLYRGHTADILDLSWSKNYFILSSSMDKTVRLWHVSRRECLCCFQHIDFVTAIAFHPRDDRYFLSGSLDGKLRLWSIPDKKVALWNEVNGSSKLITAANFCLNGRFAVVGTYDGRCIFYNTEQLKYYTQILVRSTRGKNSRGRKISGIEPMPGEDKVLVTSNDSRIRLYDLRDLTLNCKYKGCANNSSQIKASFSHTNGFIICGSEDRFVYIWRTNHEFHKLSSARRDRSDFWEGIRAHGAVVTVAIFSPNPSLILKQNFSTLDSDDQKEIPEVRGEVFVSADFSGAIKVFINKFKPGSG